MQSQIISDYLLSHQLLQALPAAVYTCNATGYIQLYNKAAVELWGREPIVGEDLWCGSWKIYKPDGSPLPLDECPMAITLREGRKVEGEEIIIEKPNGERRVIMPYPQAIFDDSGRIAGAVNMLLDITDKKESEKGRQVDRGEVRFQKSSALKSPYTANPVIVIA